MIKESYQLRSIQQPSVCKESKSGSCIKVSGNVRIPYHYDKTFTNHISIFFMF